MPERRGRARRLISPGPKLPALAGNRLPDRDGIPTAMLAAGGIQLLVPLDSATEWAAQKALLRGPVDLRAASIVPDTDERIDQQDGA
jgi:ATP-dependent helicase Lhr and Lhr-like helicase